MGDNEEEKGDTPDGDSNSIRGSDEEIIGVGGDGRLVRKKK
jgi:hypothetical protein